MKLKGITITEVKCLAHALVKKMLAWNESIPAFGTRFPNVLESCLATPFQTFNKKVLYKGLMPKAAALFYLMIKNHPFENGNKRIAMTSLFVFLHKNGKWIKVDNQELYNFVVWVAQSNPKIKDETLAAIENLSKHTL